ncbi:MAG TPA: glycosyl hydrolase family 18 protein, partial [Gemmatimonadaceae bacterium]
AGGARQLYDDPVARERRHPHAMSIVTSWLGDRFHPETVRRLAGDSARLARTASEVARLAVSGGYRGLVLDLEGHEPEDLEAMLRVAGALADSARARGIATVALAIPATDTAAYPAAPLLRVADALIVMLYDEHWAGSAPGPTASPAWARHWLAVRAAEVGPERLVAGLPLYGYQWTGRDTAARTIGWRDARRVAASAGVPLARDAASATLTARLPGDWELWVTDVVLVERLAADARALGVRRLAFWRLGLEDPAVWEGVLRR